MNEALYTRDGHPSMLSLDRYDAGELDGTARHGLESHVEACADCRARLDAVVRPSVVLLPRTAGRSSTGSATIAYLAASTAFAMAAGAVLWLGAPAWPSKHTARESISEPAHMASSYTSVAQDYSDDATDLELELSSTRVATGGSVTATPRGDGWLAIVTIEGELDVGDTDGGAEPIIAAVLVAPRATTESITASLPRRADAGHAVAIFCPAAFSLEPGDVLAPEPGCVARDEDEG